MEFFTATCLNWQPLLADPANKQIIMDSLQFLVKEQRIHLSAYVIMPNHIHLLWEKQEAWHENNVQLMFMKFTAQQIRFRMKSKGEKELRNYISSQSDRQYQFWERRPWRAQMHTRSVVEQKLDYIHLNPVEAGLCKFPEEYHYSSFRYYETGLDEYGILSHYMEHV